MDHLMKIVLISIVLSILCFSQTVNGDNQLIDVEPPKFFKDEPSPLANRENLQSREYFNFLNFLYRHDQTKANLFENQQATHVQPAFVAPSLSQQRRYKRAVIFRPLFVYREQQVKKQRQREDRDRNTNQNNSHHHRRPNRI